MSATCYRELVVSAPDSFDDGRIISLPASAATSSSFGHSAGSSSSNSFGSAFVYRLDHPLAKRRFIQWRATGSSLHLQEVSLDYSLCGATLRLVLPSQIVPNVIFQEVYHPQHTPTPALCVTVVTVDRRLFRFVFRHPATLEQTSARPAFMHAQDDTASAASVFDGVTLASIQYDYISNVCKSEITQVCAVEPLTLAIGTRQGSVHITSLRTLNEFVSRETFVSDTFELKDTGMLKAIFNRVWSSTTTNDVVGLACLPRRTDAILFSLTVDEKIRAWSLRDQKMLLSVSLPADAWDERTKSQPGSATPSKAARSAGASAATPTNRSIRFWSDNTNEKFRVAVYSVTGAESQFAIFEGAALEADGDISLKLAGISYLVDSTLIDFQVSDTAIWTLWKGESGFSVKQLPVVAQKSALELNAWQEIALEDIDDSVDILYEFDPSIENYPELFLSIMFEPGRFSARSLRQGLSTYSGEDSSSSTSVQELRIAFAFAVEQALEQPGGTHLSLGRYGVYLQWRRLLNDVSDAWLSENEPCGIFVLPGGVVGLTNKDTSSIFMPCDIPDALYIKSHILSTDNILDDQPQTSTRSVATDVSQLLAAVQFCTAHLSPAVITEFQDSLRNYADPIEAANSLLVQSLVSVISPIMSAYGAESDLLIDQNEPRPFRASWKALQFTQRLALLQDGRDQARRSRHLFMSRFLRRFKAITDPVRAVQHLLDLFTQTPSVADVMQTDNNPAVGYGETLENILARGSRYSIRSKFSLLRNLATFLLLVARTHPKSGLSLEQTEAFSSTVFPALTNLLREYAVMFFACREFSVVDVVSSPDRSSDSSETIDFSQLSLREEPNLMSQAEPSLRKTIPLLKLFLQSVRSSVCSLTPVSEHISFLQRNLEHFSALLRPSNPLRVPFKQTLLSCLNTNKQFATLRDFIIILNGSSPSTKHLLGMAYVGLNESESALECFMQAALSAQHDHGVLDELIPAYSVDHAFGTLHDSVAMSKQLAYWRLLVKEFEELKLPDLAVQCALAAISHLQSLQHRPGVNAQIVSTTISSLWTDVFAQSLQMRDFEQAYLATMYLPSGGSADQRDCLRQLLVDMAEKQSVQQLVAEFPYVGLLEEVHDILLQRARSTPVSEAPNYYHILYSLHVHRSNYRRAAQLAYECAECILYDGHSEDPNGLQFVYSYSAMLLAALNALRMVDPQYSWIQPDHPIPKRARASSLMRASPKRKHDPETNLGSDESEPDVRVVALSTLENLYLNAQCVAKLIMRETSHPIALMLRQPIETLQQLISHSLFDDAVTLAFRLELDMTSLFEELTRRTVTGDSPVSNQAWAKLQSLLNRYDGPRNNWKYALSVASTILFRDSRIKLPLWLVQFIANMSPSEHQVPISSGLTELLRLYLDFDLIEDALKTAISIFKEAHNKLSQDQAIESKRQVLVPYSLVDRLQLRFRELKRAATADRSTSTGYFQTLDLHYTHLDQMMSRFVATRRGYEVK